jgi:hypothetical protein
MSEKITTAFGEADIPALVRAYETMKRADARKREWLKTDRGKEWNREKATEYYRNHKEEVLEKRRQRYEQNREVILAKAKEAYAKKKLSQTEA